MKPEAEIRSALKFMKGQLRTKWNKGIRSALCWVLEENENGTPIETEEQAPAQSAAGRQKSPAGPAR